MDRQTLTVKEVADLFGVHTDTIYTMVKQKQLPHLKIGNRILFSKQSIELWIEDQEFASLRTE
ncbi:helix-turn-helix domain-containing protein [Virgibacillus sp. 179-BFC.A HS]|uniref:Helix-turn-helix domain-containing protein n=1 Tax=Tigheibacillus jepli TaxID=3035914 RepID=A0ABU5CDZ2_9BACI|nr:helix-turn-helix domain-containing protein [Virgibacillus sp. 179-BFC.A HS]MDY0404216.1 helix-turn-helix domain-containing protein [Virgibacillus sp. 179-BFC.A HS]